MKYQRLKRDKERYERILAKPKWKYYATVAIIWALWMAGVMLLLDVKWPGHEVTWVRFLQHLAIHVPGGFFMAWVIRQGTHYDLRRTTKKLKQLQTS